MMKVLYTAFKGKTNTAKVLLDNLKVKDKLYLTNSFKTSVEELKNTIETEEYDLIISFGQRPITEDTVQIEKQAKLENIYKTTYDFSKIKEHLQESNYTVLISEDAGDYICNNLYYYGLKYIRDNKMRCKMLFIHIPKKNDITDIKNLTDLFNDIFTDLETQ